MTQRYGHTPHEDRRDGDRRTETSLTQHCGPPLKTRRGTSLATAWTATSIRRSSLTSTLVQVFEDNPDPA